MSHLRLFLLSCCCWAATLGTARAQGKLTGMVQDSVTREPLAFASVFLANTTLGVTTTEKGEFVFPRVPAGIYDVVGSYVGYRLGKQSVTMGPTAQRVTLNLGPTGTQLGEVVVKPEPNDSVQYQKFAELLLGKSAFSAQCRIANPDQVRVFYDDSTGELRARTKRFLQIDNEALGYRVKYYNLEFGYADDDKSMYYYGEPVFEEMTPRDEQQQQQWAANRYTAYTGSFMHFLRSVYRNRLRADGFLTQQVRVRPNRAYARAGRLRQNLLARRPDGRFTAAEQDSLDRLGAVAPMVALLNPTPRPIDSLRRVSADGKRVYLRFRDELQVAHFGEAPDPHYPRPMSPLGASRKPYPAQQQVSRLKLRDREAEIQANGSVVNPDDVLNAEYWAFEKIGEFLPIDYVPPASAPTP